MDTYRTSLAILLLIPIVSTNVIPDAYSKDKLEDQLPIFRNAQKTPITAIILGLLPPRLKEFDDELKSSMSQSYRKATPYVAKSYSLLIPTKVDEVNAKNEIAKTMDEVMKTTLSKLEEFDEEIQAEKNADMDLVEGINMMVENNETLDQVVDDTLREDEEILQ